MIENDIPYYIELNKNCEALLFPGDSKRKVNVSEAMGKITFLNYLYDEIRMLELSDMMCVEEYYIDKNVLDSLNSLFIKFKIPESYHNVLLHYYISTYILRFEHKLTGESYKKVKDNVLEHKKLISILNGINNGEFEITNFSIEVKPTSKPKVPMSVKFKMVYSIDQLVYMIKNWFDKPNNFESYFSDKDYDSAKDPNIGYKNILKRTMADYSKKMYEYLSPLLDCGLAKDNIYLIIGSIMFLSELLEPEKNENSFDESALIERIKKQVNRN